MIKTLLEPRPDVISGRLQGVVDLERVTDSRNRAIESRVLDFFESTYVTGDVRRLITGLERRLTPDAAETGLFLAEGHKGEGKSHALLTALHLVQNGSELSEWLSRHGLSFTILADTRVVWRKFTDFPLDSLWGVIADDLKVNLPRDRPPNIKEFREALGNQKLVLIFDELESGIRAIPNAALKQQNLNFLQMLSEESNRSGSNVAMVASIYDGNIEPGLTLKRVARVELRFQDSTDRRRILFHRLFAKSPIDKSPEIDGIIQSHVNTWRRFGVSLPPDYADEFRQSFPFMPEVLDTILVRIRAMKGGFQGTRGALGFLATLVRARCDKAHVITLADAGIADQEMRSWLADLDPSQHLLTCAESNLKELNKHPYADQIASTVLLASLAPSPKEQGITEDELARQVVGPDADYNAFGLSLANFKKFGSFFHERSGSLYFDTRENAHAKVNLRSLSVSHDEAWEKIVAWWGTDILRDANVTVFSDVATTQQDLEARGGDELRLIVAPRRLGVDEVHGLLFGLRKRNTVLMIEPRDEKTNLRTNDSLLAYAKRWIAADYLARTASDATRGGEFSRIGAEDKKNALDYLKKTNLAYVQILEYGDSPDKTDIQRESLPSAASRQTIIEHINRVIFPPALVQEHLAARIDQYIGKKVSYVEADYRNTPSYPVLTSRSIFLEAVQDLVEQGNVVGVRHANDQACGRRPRLSSDQLAEAVLSEPFQEVSGGSNAPKPVPPGPRPDGAGETQSGPLGGLGGAVNPGFGPQGSVRGEAVESVSTGFLRTRQQVRQEVARILDVQAGAHVVEVKFAISYDPRHMDMGALPTFIRGTLTGTGTFSGEAALSFTGAFSKAQVEEMVERLPDFTPGACRITLRVKAGGAST